MRYLILLSVLTLAACSQEISSTSSGGDASPAPVVPPVVIVGEKEDGDEG